MLRGLTRSGVPVTGAQFIDITQTTIAVHMWTMRAVTCSPRSEAPLASSTGGHSQTGAIKRNGPFPTVPNGSAWHRSRTPALHLRHEQVTYRLSPQSNDRGPIEAGLGIAKRRRYSSHALRGHMTAAPLKLLPGNTIELRAASDSPRSHDRGPIEAI